MKSLSTIFWLVVLGLIIYAGFQVVPIYYRGLIGIRGVCKENADVYHKYGKGYIQTAIAEQLEGMGIPRDKRQVKVSQSGDSVIVWIRYEDSATFFERYNKDFEFEYECEGVLRSVYN
jgi:hypothetical protein